MKRSLELRLRDMRIESKTSRSHTDLGTALFRKEGGDSDSQKQSKRQANHRLQRNRDSFLADTSARNTPIDLSLGCLEPTLEMTVFAPVLRTLCTLT